jgi:hypothetical protein
MECPKCHHIQTGPCAECERCGLIFAKYRQRPTRGEAVTPPAQYKEPSRLSRVLDYLLYLKPTGGSTGPLYARAFLLLLLFLWSWWFWLSPPEANYAGRSFMHLVNLPFHEAGHVFARPLGSFMTSLGGSLNQILMPLVCAVVLLVKTRDGFGASVALWWMGESFMDLAPYIGDARSMSLMLLGGNTGYSSPYGFHDWNYLLTEAGLLEHDALLAGLSAWSGVLLMAVSVAWGAAILLRAGRRGTGKGS